MARETGKTATGKSATSRSARSGRGVVEMSRETAHAVAGRIIGEAPLGSQPDREAPRNVEVWATRPYAYDGVSLDRGQVFRLKGLRNDKLLTDLDYCQAVETPGRFPCRVCASVFMDPWALEGHGKLRHAETRHGPPPPQRMDEESTVAFEARLDQWSLSIGDAADNDIMRQDKIADEVHPLNLEQTAASRGA